MGHTKVLIKKTKTATTPEGRLRHRYQVFAGNGKLVDSSTPNQKYYNEPELYEGMRITNGALTSFFSAEIVIKMNQLRDDCVAKWAELNPNLDKELYFNAVDTGMNILLNELKG